MMAESPEGTAEVERSAAERLTFFTDAVAAIALTLLAIELPVPEGFSPAELWQSVGENSYEYLAFAISFVVIAAHWSTHHDLFRWVVRVDDAVLRLGQGVAGLDHPADAEPPVAPDPARPYRTPVSRGHAQNSPLSAG